jgi:hypothetical protein
MPQDTPPGLLMEGGWRPAYEAATADEAVLVETIRRLLPRVAQLMWNVRNDLSPLDMGAIMAERMRLLGPAGMWAETAALERCLEAARAGLPPC